MKTNFSIRNLTRLTLCGLLACAALAGPARAQYIPVLTGDTKKLSYALGMDLGTQLRRLSIDVDPTIFGKVLADGLAGGPTLMPPEEARVRIAALQDAMKRRQAATGTPAQDNGAARNTTPAAEAGGEGEPAPEPAR